LSSIGFGDDFLTIFVTGLKHNVRLERLYLRGNCITVVGAVALATALYYNQTLRYLSLSYNSIGHDGAIAILTALRYHPHMEYLDVTGNPMTKDGFLKLYQCFKYNESIQHLYCVNNAVIESELIQSIEDYNNTLREVFASIRRRDTTKKCSGRRQHIYTWMTSNWIHVINNQEVPTKKAMH
jgi:Leucine Rich repeat